MQGFAAALQLENLLFIFLGVLVGQVVGALPGFGPAAGMALLLPLTFGLEPLTGTPQLYFEMPSLFKDIDFSPLAIGVLGIKPGQMLMS